MKPKSLEELIVRLAHMPGISKKQAEKIAFAMVDSKKDEAEDISIAIKLALKNIKRCSICNHITEEGECSICTSKDRKSILVVVETPMDIFKFEDAQKLRPYYHVLGGLVNVSKNIDAEDLNVSTLANRAKEYKEVIIALSPNIEGIVTANYIKSLLGNKKVTQLAQGIPLGAAMEYVDELTLKAAVDNRKEVK